MSWEIENRKLCKEFHFKNFKEALNFVNHVAKIAEEMNHHPDILIHSYKKVFISLITHSKNQVTDLDYQQATKIDLI